MLSYLRESRSLLNASAKVCYVIGNESCDLDSAVSAIALAYFYARTSPVLSTKPTGFLPLLNIPRKSYPIKTEVAYYLKKYNITDEQLIFKDDTNDKAIRENSVILVDHHVSSYKDSVVEVFDHRPFDNTSNLPATCKTNIQQVGSCATLIGDRILRSTKSHDEFNMILQLLYGAIVLDTVKFSPSACRTTELDLKVAGEIESTLGISNPTEHRQSLFAELVKAREDISTLTAYQLLFKDMKLISNPSGTIKIGIPGYPINVQEYIRKPDAKEAVRKYADELDCSVVLLVGMKITNSSDVSRDVGVINIKNNGLFKEIVHEVQTSQNPNLELNEHLNCDFLDGRFFQQNNLRVTRKHLLPILKKVLENK